MALFAIAVTAAIAVGLANAQSASISKHCPFKDICYSLNLPTKTLTTGHGELYFQISGPDTYSWIALGQGEGMEGANIFVIYANGKGNVTLSPRLAIDMVEPLFNPDAELELLAGSGISDGRMFANVKCSSCKTWQGGSTDLLSDVGTWIGAGLPGPPLDSTDPEEHIQKHFVHAVFPWSMVEARGGPDTNPFVTQQNRGQQAPGGVGTHMGIAHGVLASLAFIAILPSGSIFIRFARFPRLVWAHAAIQVTGYLVYVAAAGMGIHMLLDYPGRYHRYEIYRDPHPKIGMALLAYLFFQPISGAINHWMFGRKNKRVFSHYIHIWGGRLAILLGFINGGFGLRLGKVESTGARASYGVFATIMGVLFIISTGVAEKYRDAPNPSLLHRGKKGESGEMGERNGHVRMESTEERSHTAQNDRSE